MRKALNLLGSVLLIDLLGTPQVGVIPLPQRPLESPDDPTNVIRLLNTGRAPSYTGIFPAMSFAQDRPASPLHSSVNISYQQVQPILAMLSENLLPAELKNRNPAEMAALWPSWVTRHDRETQARLARGELDTMVSFLVMGTSFTRQPPLTARQFNSLPRCRAPSSRQPSDEPECAVFAHRVDDLVRGLARPGNSERLLFLSHLAERQGYHPRTAYGVHPDLAEQRCLRAFVLTNVARVGNEQEQLQAEYEGARQRDDHPENVAAVSTLYSSRGLSLDTSLLPNMAVEESLKEMLARGLLTLGSVRRAAVVGPGLDFTDKAGGYDFYPQQTLQCFALVDTLFRLGLARRGKLDVTTLDISTRVNDHLRRARRRAELGQAYVVQLPRPAEAGWKEPTSRYWRQFGDQIGTPVTPIQPPAPAGSVETRAVQIAPAIVSLITPVDLDIITAHLELPPNEGFDLIIATNVFCYFDSFEQLLAVANLQSMLRPGGFLLSNNILPLLPSSSMRSVDLRSVSYSDRPNDGDVIAWYQRPQD